MTEESPEKLKSTATEILLCAKAWEPDARLMGNVRAEDIASLCEAFVGLFIETDIESENLDPKCPDGFSENKGDDNYWLDAVREFWSKTGLDYDETELVWIVNWFDSKRNRPS